MKEKVYEKRTIILTVTIIDRTGFSVFYLKDHFVYSIKRFLPGQTGYAPASGRAEVKAESGKPSDQVLHFVLEVERLSLALIRKIMEKNYE